MSHVQRAFTLLKFLQYSVTQYAHSVTHLPSNYSTQQQRSHPAFCFVNTFTQPNITVLRWPPFYKQRPVQYCHSLHRLSDKQLWRRVEIFVHPTYIVNTQTAWHYKQQCYIWDTSRGTGILTSRVITAFIRADLRRLSLFCDRQDC